ncbi:N-acetyltransferase [Aliidongia dinghuensis]|uniref:N-acetyltransferase n=1 Tax=Aliidongia dinghuensis TaxID=1867774 RepID=A0A8J3E3D8_9PROT|nr:GNAT family N-acetyltransferase [Aliidongia dinghuensis]GGF17803.1 N-acetyltransferase [Aliidongia dinghuensis]
MSEIQIRPLTKTDAGAFRALRLEGLSQAPDAFSAAYEDEVRRSDEQFAARIPDASSSVIFGAFRDGRLVAMTGLMVPAGLKERHKGLVWGVYVGVAARGLGLARRLLDRVMTHARTVDGLEILQLGVGVHNEPAKAVYAAAGFEVYGVERKALKLTDGRYVDEELRVLELRSG